MGNVDDRSEWSEASSLTSRDVNLESVVLLGRFPSGISWRIQLQRSTFDLECDGWARDEHSIIGCINLDTLRQRRGCTNNR
jgi:hypothetical protein